jgi:HK97 family phage prohead protease
MREKSLTIKSIDEETGVFNAYLSTYENTDRDGDVIKTGAFDASVQNKQTVPMLFNHDRNKVIGKLELNSDDVGLKVKGTLNLNDDVAKNVHDLLKMKALDAMSVGMLIEDYTPLDKNHPFGAWNIEKATVVEGSVVTIPANEKATISSVKKLTEDEYIEFMTLKREKRLAKVVEILKSAEEKLNAKF